MTATDLGAGTADAGVLDAGARAVVAPGGRVPHLSTRPPLTLRQVRSEDPAVAALCLVGSAAGPLAGDRRDLSVDLLAGARATLVATGATLAQGRAGRASSLRTWVRLGPDAGLDARPGPLVACAGSRVEVRLDLALAATSRLAWSEVLVLGRSGEEPGQVRLHWVVDRDERPVLRQSLDLTAAGTAWRGVLDGARVLATTLLTGPSLPARTVVAGPGAVAQRVDEHTALVTVLSTDTAHAEAVLAELVTAIGAGDRRR